MSLINYVGEDKIFVDANIFLFHAFNNIEYGEECTIFLRRIEKGEIIAVINPIIIDETLFKILMAEVSELMSKPSLWDLKKKLKENDKEFIGTIYKPVKEYKGYLTELTYGGLTVAELNWKIAVDSVAMGEKYGLLTSDAFHLATMKQNGIKHIATNDSDFDSVEFLTIWKPQQRMIQNVKSTE